jgi:regulator of protease activity HflC (stomatin/prohibitin superfamily)
VGALIALAVLVVLVLVVMARSLVRVQQAQSFVIERLGRFHRVLDRPGLTVLVPFVDRVRARVDLRERVVSLRPQPIVTADNLTVHIDTMIFFQVTDPRGATYEISDYLMGIEQLTVTTLRNVVGEMSLEQAVASREQINGSLRAVLEEATGAWGIRVDRVEVKAIEPAVSVQDPMDRQRRADQGPRATARPGEGRPGSATTSEEALVLRTVDRDSGLVRLRGEEWPARAFDPAQVLFVGRTVNVMEIQGETALVWGEP